MIDNTTLVTIISLVFAAFVMVWTLLEARRREGIHQLAMDKLRQTLQERDDQVSRILSAQTNHATLLFERSKPPKDTAPRNGVHQAERGIL